MPKSPDRPRGTELQTVKLGGVSRLEAAADAPTLTDRSGLGHGQAGNEDPLIGSICGKYRLTRLLGRGGMGSVYEGVHQQIQKRAAIKVLSHDLSLDPVFAGRFFDEARAVHIVRHPGLVETLEFDQRQDGMLYLIMEYVDGESLAARLARDGAFSEHQALPLILQLARAIASAHERGVVHRDLKPSNIMLTPDPVRPGELQVKVLDFGIAKLLAAPSGGEPEADTIRVARTDKDDVLGTHGYMAPEQYDSAAQVEGRADVFSLGCIIFEMLTGQAAGRTAVAIVAKLSELIQQLSRHTSAATAAMVRSMLMAEPSGRPSMRAIVQSLERRLQPRWLHYRGPLVLGLALVLVLTGAVSWVVYRSSLSALRRRAIAIVHDQGLLANALDTRQHALYLLGQSQDTELSQLVIPILSDRDPRVREAAAKAMERLATPSHFELLQQLAAQRPATVVQLFAARAAERLRPGSVSEPVQEALSSAPASLRIQADMILFRPDDRARTARLKAWFTQFGSSASQPLLFDVLTCLVAARDLDAVRRLNELLATLPDSPERLRMASLAIEYSSGSEQFAYDLLQRTAEGGGDLQVQAARYLAELGRTSVCSQLSAIANQSTQSVGRRMVAVSGLALCAREQDLALLRDLMADSQPVAALRLEAAGAFLSLLASEPAREGASSVQWLLQAKQSASEQQRELAMLALGMSDSSDAVDSLQQGLRDKSARVRLQAIRSLARKPTRGAALALQQTLQDPVEDIQSASIVALQDVVQRLVQTGDRDIASLIKPTLERHANDPSSPIQVSTQGLLVRLGNTQQRRALATTAAGSNTRLRLRAIPWLDDQTMLVAGLSDKDIEVRTASALRLAELGSQAGVSVLRAVSGTGEILGLRSYVALLRLRVPAPAPPDLDSLLTTAAPSIRSEAIEVLGNLRSDIAATKLRLVMHDASPGLRYQAVDVALRLLRKQPAAALIEVLQAGLRQETEIIVRDKILQALKQATPLAGQASKSPQNEGRTRQAELAASTAAHAVATGGGPANAGLTPAVSPAAAAGEPQGAKQAIAELPRGSLVVSGPRGLRIRINDGAPLTLPLSPQAVGPGIYRISFVGGSRLATVQPGQRVSIQLPDNAVLNQLYQELPSVGRLQVVDQASFNADRLAMFERKVEQAPGDPMLKQNLLLQVALQYDAYGYSKRACAIYAKLSGSEVATSFNQDGRLSRARQKCASLK